MFRTVPLSIIKSFSLYTQRWQLTANLYDIYYCCVYSEKLLMMDRRTARNMQFYSKNKFQKLVNLICFIIRIRVSCYERSLLSVPGDQKLSYAIAMSKTQSILPLQGKKLWSDGTKPNFPKFHPILTTFNPVCVYTPRLCNAAYIYIGEQHT